MHDNHQNQPHGSSSSRSRRAIVTFTAEQRLALEEFYLTWSGDLNAEEKKQLVALSEQIGLSKHQIRGWLRNRRIRGTYKGKITHDVEQVRALEWLYNNYSRYPSSKFNHELAVIVGMTYPQVKKWFQARRQRGSPALILSADPDDPLKWEETKDRLRNLILKSGESDAFGSFVLSGCLKRTRGGVGGVGGGAGMGGDLGEMYGSKGDDVMMDVGRSPKRVCLGEGVREVGGGRYFVGASLLEHQQPKKPQQAHSLHLFPSTSNNGLPTTFPSLLPTSSSSPAPSSSYSAKPTQLPPLSHPPPPPPSSPSLPTTCFPEIRMFRAAQESISSPPHHSQSAPLPSLSSLQSDSQTTTSPSSLPSLASTSTPLSSLFLQQPQPQQAPLFGSLPPLHVLLKKRKAEAVGVGAGLVE